MVVICFRCWHGLSGVVFIESPQGARTKLGLEGCLYFLVFPIEENSHGGSPPAVGLAPILRALCERPAQPIIVKN